MNTTEQIREVLLKEIETATHAGDFRTVEALARLGSQILREEPSRHSPPRSAGRSRVGVEHSADIPLHRATSRPDQKSKRSQDLIRGAGVRKQFLQEQRTHGNPLDAVQGKRLYEASDGQRWFVAFSSENTRNSGHFFFGVHDEPVDVIVFLCLDANEETHRFIVPAADLSHVWEKLVVRDGERKINIVRRGSSWSLRVPSIDQDIPMDQYRRLPGQT